MVCFEIDVSNNPQDDVLDPEVEKLIVQKILDGQVVFVWLGMPCATFSAARRDDGRARTIEVSRIPHGAPMVEGPRSSKVVDRQFTLPFYNACRLGLLRERCCFLH